MSELEMHTEKQLVSTNFLELYILMLFISHIYFRIRYYRSCTIRTYLARVPMKNRTFVLRGFIQRVQTTRIVVFITVKNKKIIM